MDTNRRTFFKAITWQLLGIVTMTFLSYTQTGSLTGALTLAVSASLSGFFFFMLHEKLWNLISWGRRPSA